MTFVLGITAGVISAIAYLIYFRSILRGESKPSRVTWFIWTFMGAILAASYFASGARDTMWAPLVEFIGPLITSILAIKYGEGGIESPADVLCFVGGIVSILIWIIFDAPVITLVMNLAIDGFAIIPTVMKSYERPEGESMWAWVGTAAGDGINIFAAEKPIFAILVYPIWMFLVDMTVIGALLRGRKKKQQI